MTTPHLDRVVTAKPALEISPSAAMNEVVWGTDPLYKVELRAPEVPIDPRQFTWIMGMARQPLLRRLLWLCHFTACRRGGTNFRIAERAMAARLWAGVPLPDNWRRSLRDTLSRISKISNTPEFVLQPDKSFLVRVPPEFFGSLAVLIRPGRPNSAAVPRLTLLKHNPDPQRRLTRGQRDFLRHHGWDSDDEGEPLSNCGLQTLFQKHGERAAQVPTLARIAKEHGSYRTIFVPALLGHEAVCRELGPLVQLLVNNHTRWRKGVTAGMIAGGGKVGTKVVYEALDKNAVYESFAGNNGGRGFRTAFWAEQFGTDEETLLAQLAQHTPRLGLIPVGVDKHNRFFSVEELQGSPALRETVNLRVYVLTGFRERWAAIFGWVPPNEIPRTSVPGTPPPARSDPKAPGLTDTDHAVLRERVLGAGLRKTATAVEIAPGHLSRFLKHRRGISVTAVTRLRHHILASPTLTPERAKELFAGCETLQDFAVAYRQCGWCVVPLVPGSRQGYVRWKQFQTCLPTLDQVRSWWAPTQWPDASIGIVLGPISGLLVVDSDDVEVLPMAQDLLGETFTTCPMVISGSHMPGRFHFYFRHPNAPTLATNTSLHKRLEIRGRNGLIIAPPSLHKTSGLKYEWGSGRAITQVPLPEAPPKLLKFLEEAHARRSTKQASSASRVPPSQAGSGGFAQDFSTWNGARVPTEVAEFLRGEHAHGSGWNNRIFGGARWCRHHGVPQDLAETVLVAGAGPTSDIEKGKAIGSIRSAYEHIQKTRPDL